jgi:hypothetical protein
LSALNGQRSGLTPHTHLGDEYGTVGSYIVKQGDNEAKTYNAGESWHVPAGVVHESKNAAPITKTMNAFIVEKDKPLIRLGDPRFGGESRPTHTRTKSFKEDRRALSRHALGRSILNMGIDGPFVFRRAVSFTARKWPSGAAWLGSELFLRLCLSKDGAAQQRPAVHG